MGHHMEGSIMVQTEKLDYETGLQLIILHIQARDLSLQTDFVVTIKVRKLNFLIKLDLIDF